MRSELEQLKTLIESYKKDEALWVKAETAPEAYMQHKLSSLVASVGMALDLIGATKEKNK